MNREMFIFMLIFAHFLADYAFQSAWISEMKKTKFWPMIVHCSIYTGCIVFVLTKWADISWWIIGGIFISHWLIDNLRIILEKKRIGNCYVKFIRSEDDWLPTFVDQFLHFCVLILLILKYN